MLTNLNFLPLTYGLNLIIQGKFNKFLKFNKNKASEIQKPHQLIHQRTLR